MPHACMPKLLGNPYKRPGRGERVEVFGGEIHSDVWGPAPVESRGGKRYYVTFIDDKSCLTTLYLLRMKDELLGAYKQYKAWVETQMGAKLKALNLDQGGEYQGADFVEYLKSKGTIQKLNVHDTPQHAGVAEHHNRTIGERLQALLHASGLPKFLWGEVARHIVWLLNRTTMKAVEGMTLFQAAFGKKPDLKNVCEWGEKIYVRIEGGTKLGGRVREGWWLGIGNELKGVHVYWPDTKTVTVERNIYHDNTAVNRQEDENIVIGLTRDNLPPIVNLPTIVQENPVNHKESADESEVEAMSKRIRKPSQKVTVLLGEKQGLAPGVQKPSDEWMAVVEACEDEYAFVTEIEEAEALKLRNLKEAKGVC